MLLVFAVCAAPILLGTWAYYFYRPEGRTNYGELLRPTPLAVAAERLDGASFSVDILRDKWTLVTIDSPSCDERCRAKLFATRQVRAAQGRDQDRVARLWLLDGPGTPAADLEPLLAGATIARITAGVAAFGERPFEHLYLVDPAGNLMMRFPAAPEPKRFIADLQKLLRVNNRGR